MARIRTIKPEYWTSEQVVDCSPTARLMFIGIWNFCDDAGRHQASAKRLKMEVFPSDSFTIEEVNGWISELKSSGLLIEYSVEGQSFWQVTGWHHQKIDKPTVKFPGPESTNPTRTLDEHSSNPIRTLDDSSPPEGNGREGNGYIPDSEARPIALVATAGNAGKDSVFKEITREVLRDNTKLWEWLQWQGTNPEGTRGTVLEATDENFENVIAVAEHALSGKVKAPDRLFGMIVGKQSWGRVTPDQRASARRRIADFRGTSK